MGLVKRLCNSSILIGRAAYTLAGLKFRAQENGLMSTDGVFAISAGPAGQESKCIANQWNGLLD